MELWKFCSIHLCFSGYSHIQINQQSIHLQAIAILYGIRENRQNTNVQAYFCTESRDGQGPDSCGVAVVVV